MVGFGDDVNFVLVGNFLGPIEVGPEEGSGFAGCVDGDFEETIHGCEDCPGPERSSAVYSGSIPAAALVETWGRFTPAGQRGNTPCGSARSCRSSLVGPGAGGFRVAAPDLDSSPKGTASAARGRCDRTWLRADRERPI